MEDTNTSPPPCPKTITIRRNPPRRARPTPSSSVAPIMPFSPSSVSHNIPSFPTEEILSIQLPPYPNPENLSPPDSENLRVFLRIRPLAPATKQQRCKNAWPKSKNGSREKAKNRTEICVTADRDSSSVTVSPPMSLQEGRRVKTEAYGGFSQVFSAESTQDEVYAKMVNPLVEEFLQGKSGMLAALGPSGSGKTHTVFGTPREPGMIPLTLRRIFSRTEDCNTQLSRIFCLSMFEICSERGKAERLIDLFQDVGDLCMQQSTVKGVQEVSITNVQQAESLVARGRLKRATARTNSNNQSSRSQCIINIRGSPHGAIFTVVDLAGAEREKRTGNQGARLLESNFINNTSMVFGLCLRSLLEHQKNPKKPLQKHFQNSLLTRYLRDYLEGKRRMALILTVKSGVEDYLDTSFLLRQASPYMKIKFNNAEEPLNSVSTKRSFQAFPRVERLKRMKLRSVEAFHTNEGNGAGDGCRFLTEEALPPEIMEPEDCSGHPRKTTNSDLNNDKSLEEGSNELEKERKNVIMQNFAKAIWNVLKQYKEKLEMAENQIQILNKSLANEKERSLRLEIELKDLKSNLLYEKEVSLKGSVESNTNRSAGQEGCQYESDHKLNAGAAFLEVDEAKEEISDTNVNNAGGVIASSITVEDFEKQGCQITNKESHAFPRDVDIVEDSNDRDSDDTQFDRNGSDSGPSEDVISSPKSLGITSDSCSSVEWSQSERKEDKLNAGLSYLEPDEGNEEISDTSVNNAGVVIASSVTVEDLEEQGYQFTNQESEAFPRDVDIAEDPKDEGTDDTHFDRNGSDSGPSEYVVMSPKSLFGTTNDSCSSVGRSQSESEEDKKQLDQRKMPEEGAELPPRCDAHSATKSDSKDNSSSRALNAERPKRRLLPASSILLKNISSLEFEDEYEKPKGGRGEKKLVPEERNRTQGSISLLRLLRTNLHL